MNPNEILTRAADKLEQLAFGLGAEEFWQKDIARADLSIGAREWAPVMGPAIAKPLVALLRDVAESWPPGKRVEWMNDGAKAALELATKILGTCGAVSDSDVRCGKPAGHEDHHAGTGTEAQVAAGGPLFSRWSNTKTTPTSTLTGQPCTGHPADERCIECATDTEIRAAIPQPEAAVYVHQETNHG